MSKHWKILWGYLLQEREFKVNYIDTVNNNTVVNTNIPSIPCTDHSHYHDLSPSVIIHHSHEISDGKVPISSKIVEIGSIKRATKREERSESNSGNSGESEISITERSKRMRLLTEQLLGGFGGKAREFVLDRKHLKE